MSSDSPDPAPAAPAPAESGAGDPLTAAAAVSLRLLAGAVPKRTLDGLQRTVQQSPSEYPWQVVTRVVLAEPVDDRRLLEQGLRAQRDWILRGGRETPGKPISVHAKTFVAKVVAQLIFVGVYTVVIVVLLLLLKHRWPEVDIYRALDWLYSTFPNLRRG